MSIQFWKTVAIVEAVVIALGFCLFSTVVAALVLNAKKPAIRTNSPPPPVDTKDGLATPKNKKHQIAIKKLKSILQRPESFRLSSIKTTRFLKENVDQISVEFEVQNKYGTMARAKNRVDIWPDGRVKCLKPYLDNDEAGLYIRP